jgi:hypothetical protein
VPTRDEKKQRFVDRQASIEARATRFLLVRYRKKHLLDMCLPGMSPFDSSELPRPHEQGCERTTWPFACAVAASDPRLFDERPACAWIGHPERCHAAHPLQ